MGALALPPSAVYAWWEALLTERPMSFSLTYKRTLIYLGRKRETTGSDGQRAFGRGLSGALRSDAAGNFRSPPRGRALGERAGGAFCDKPAGGVAALKD